jgi:hypothetical protein
MIASGTLVNGTSAACGPNSSFLGGSIELKGGFTGIATLVLESRIKDSLIGIWSQDQKGIDLSFIAGLTLMFQAGSPSSSFRGSPTSVLGNVVSGNSTRDRLAGRLPSDRHSYGQNVLLATMASTNSGPLHHVIEGEPTAVRVERRPGQVRGIVAREKGRDLRDLLRFAEAPERGS